MLPLELVWLELLQAAHSDAIAAVTATIESLGLRRRSAGPALSCEERIFPPICIERGPQPGVVGGPARGRGS